MPARPVVGDPGPEDDVVDAAILTAQRHEAEDPRGGGAQARPEQGSPPAERPSVGPAHPQPEDRLAEGAASPAPADREHEDEQHVLHRHHAEGARLPGREAPIGPEDVADEPDPEDGAEEDRLRDAEVDEVRERPRDDPRLLALQVFAVEARDEEGPFPLPAAREVLLSDLADLRRRCGEAIAAVELEGFFGGGEGILSGGRITETVEATYGGKDLADLTLTEEVKDAADVVLDVRVRMEACPMNLAPTASTTATLAMGDALAVAVLEAKGFTDRDFAQLHPGGALGRRLLRVEEVMHPSSQVPLVEADTTLAGTLQAMTSGGLGTVGVTEGGKLVGVVTDGDVRRAVLHHGNLSGRTAGDLMSRAPKTVAAEALAEEALASMEKHSITSLFILEGGTGRPVGIVHLHDLLKASVA